MARNSRTVKNQWELGSEKFREPQIATITYLYLCTACSSLSVRCLHSSRNFMTMDPCELSKSSSSLICCATIDNET